MENEDVLPLGLYEILKTKQSANLKIPDNTHWIETDIDAKDALHVSSLTRFVANRIKGILDKTSPMERVQIVNSLLSTLANSGESTDQILVSDSAQNSGTITQLSELKLSSEQDKVTSRPSTPLSEVALLTNNPKEPQLGAEILKELESADRVDLLCSFLKLTGVNVLAPQLELLKRRGIPFRVITTTYMGATDRKAVDKLVNDYGAEVKISYEKNATRLHAKAWLFHRKSGFSTGYVGSSNLSHAALTEGLEWNVRISNSATPGLLAQFSAAFETYWDSGRFELYAGTAEDKNKLDRSLEQAAIGHGSSKRPNLSINYSHVDVHPYPHQSLILDDLTSERRKGHHKNLVVAATGTGKTILSALDYRQLCETAGKRLSLLFIAHQGELLRQSRSAFATVLRDQQFGEFYFDGQIPENHDAVFATIQTLSKSGMEKFDADEFDVVIIDEFHHADAPTYRKVIEYFRPNEFLGLTATPERSDGKNVAVEFFNGRIASQLRLWDALEADLLVPFHYYGIDDGTDLSSLKFYAGKYSDDELSKYYLANKDRVALILNEIERKIADPYSMRALGYCVNVDHAKFMTQMFNEANLPAAYLTGEDTAERREEIIRRLKNPNDPLVIIFTVNLFNEGVDIPEVDTLIMLRPTQSATLFQQQLGRGLRRSPDKAVLVVLDFVGLQAKGFRFDQKMSVFSRNGVVKESLIRNAELPPACSLQLGKKTEEQVLRSIKDALNPKISVLVDQVKILGSEKQKEDSGFIDTFLSDYLNDTGLKVPNIYSRRVGNRNLTMTYLLHEAGLIPKIPGFDDKESTVWDISNRIKSLTHVNDKLRIDTYRKLLTTPISEEDMSLVENRLAWMLVFSFWPYRKFKKGQDRFTLDQALAELRKYPVIISELLQIWEMKLDEDRHFPESTETLGEDIPLLTHGIYSREEIYAALAIHESENKGAPGAAVAGVLESKATKTIALSVTLSKSEQHFSPETMYRDYAVTESRFAWDSQNSTKPESRIGQIYQHHKETGEIPLLFVRYKREDDIGTAPYFFVGPVQYRSHVGSQPMHITWDLERTMPTDLFNLARIAS
ncbi:MAG: DUF3427 domain-containing protein [Arcanobacterium sp.]|nr:DUF3427 domain-containing protein [Arcanobacterium sp.]